MDVPASLAMTLSLARRTRASSFLSIPSENFFVGLLQGENGMLVMTGERRQRLRSWRRPAPPCAFFRPAHHQHAVSP